MYVFKYSFYFFIRVRVMGVVVIFKLKSIITCNNLQKSYITENSPMPLMYIHMYAFKYSLFAISMAYRFLFY